MRDKQHVKRGRRTSLAAAADPLPSMVTEAKGRSGRVKTRPTGSASRPRKFFPENYYSPRTPLRPIRSRRKRQAARPADLPLPPPEVYDQINQQLAAAHALFLSRQYPAALEAYGALENMFFSVWWVNYQNTPELQQLFLQTLMGMVDALQEVGMYSQAAFGYTEITAPEEEEPLTPDQVAYVLMRWVQMYLDWGDALFRGDRASDALTQYTQIINVDGSVPSSFVYSRPVLQPAVADAVKIITNLQQLISGQVTATSLNVNPALAGIIVQCHQQVVKIQSGLDFWGHYHNTVPIWTFEYLQSAAVNFAQFAIAAERDFINFQERSDQGSATRQQLTQLALQATAEVDAASAQATAVEAEAQAYVTGAELANRRASDAQKNADEYANTSGLAIQYQAMQSQIGGGDGGSAALLNDIADTFMAGGSVTASDDLNPSSDLYGVYSRNNVAAGAQLTAARLDQQYEVDSMQRTAGQMAIAAQQAAQEATAAQARLSAAMAGTAVARLHAEAAEQNLQAFDSQTFTPDVWQRMADAMWRLYRRYLYMALKTALMMQQAYNFETDQSLSFIKKDYSTDEVKGLLGADALMADIQSFTYDLITSTTGKPQPVRQTISLAQRYAYLFENQFRRTGFMEFETRIDDFDYVYPGTYAGRLECVQVELVGLVPPNGVSGTLTNSGISAYRTPASASTSDAQGLKYRVQNRETLVLSDYAVRVDSQMVPTDARIMGIFQGAGLVSSWQLEIPREINDIDYGALLDVRVTFFYKARYDPDLHQAVLDELASRPGIVSRQRGLQLRWIYPDAFFRFQDTGTLTFSQAVQDFASNETAPVITAIGVVIATDGTVSPQGLTVRLTTPGKTEIAASADANGVIDSGATGSPWTALLGGSALGDYSLAMTAADNPGLVSGGNLQLSPIVNIALVMGYTFTPKAAAKLRPAMPRSTKKPIPARNDGEADRGPGRRVIARA